MKNPLTPAGIEPATFRFVAQHLKHCATAVPTISWRSLVNFRSRPLYPPKDIGNYSIQRWVREREGPRTGLEVLEGEKPRLCRDSNPGPSSALPSDCADYAIPAAP